jgi:outer membrane protease
MIALDVFGLRATNVALAKKVRDPYAINFDAGSITVSTSLGWLCGESKEYMYNADTGKKSELNLKINNTAIVKGDISWDPFFWLTLNGRG